MKIYLTRRRRRRRGNILQSTGVVVCNANRKRSTTRESDKIRSRAMKKTPAHRVGVGFEVFDAEASKTFGQKRVLGPADLHKMEVLSGFTWKRLAYWMNATGKRAFKECKVIMNNHGILGQGKTKVARSKVFIWPLFAHQSAPHKGDGKMGNKGPATRGPFSL